MQLRTHPLSQVVLTSSKLNHGLLRQGRREKKISRAKAQSAAALHALTRRWAVAAWRAHREKFFCLPAAGNFLKLRNTSQPHPSDRS